MMDAALERNYEQAGGSVLWSSPEWLAEAVAWLDQQLAAARIQRTGEVITQQVRPWGAVLRAPTTSGVVWFKAASPRTAVEVRLYQLLPALAPDHVLTPIAVDPVRSWLVLPDAGHSLSHWHQGTKAIDVLVRFLPGYGQLQRDLASHLDRFDALGLPNMRPTLMPERFDQALRAVCDSVARIGTDEERVTYERVAGLGNAVRGWCAQLEALPIAASLNHGDLRPANIMLPQAGAVSQARILDWDQSVVAHPFTSMLMLLHMQQRRPRVDRAAPQTRRLKDAYLDAFTDLAPRAELEDALEAACQVAKVSRALSLILLTDGSRAGHKQALQWLALLLSDAYPARR